MIMLHMAAKKVVFSSLDVVIHKIQTSRSSQVNENITPRFPEHVGLLV